MDFIPIEPIGDFGDFLASACSFPLKLKSVNNPGDLDNENIVFIATEDIESLYDFVLMYPIEDKETGLPIYGKTRFLTFDDIELQKNDLLQVYTRSGEDKTSFDSEADAFCNVVYWGLDTAIWHIPLSSFEIMKRGESYSAGPNLE